MKPKRLPRLWCALQGLLPLDACLAAQRGELAWPKEQKVDGVDAKLRSRSARTARDARRAASMPS